MGTPVVTDREALVGKVAAGLTDARQRGFDELDVTSRRPLLLAELETLARRYTGDNQSSRGVLIRRLMDDALTAWAKVQRGEHADDAAFVRSLFFPPAGATGVDRQPTTLLHNVMRARGWSDDVMETRRKAAFELFARFLIGFVSGESDVTTRSWVRRHLGWLTGGGLLAGGLVVGLFIWAPWEGGSSPPVTSTGQTSPAAATGAGGVVFTFDALGGGSSTIDVYPGVQDTTADKLANGTFSDRQTTTALCRTTGRTVRSDPSVGERPRSSDVWLRVQAQPGKTSYATLTYGRIGDAALAALPQC